MPGTEGSSHDAQPTAIRSLATTYPPPPHQQAPKPAGRDRRPSTYQNEDDARRAEREARDLLRSHARVGVTVREFWKEWTTDRLWQRSAESTNLHNAERSRRFVEAYSDKPIRAVDDDLVREYRRAGRNDGTIPALRAMFNDAMRADAGRLVDRNPFAGLRLPQSRGRRDIQPPPQADAARMIALADQLTPPSFAAYLDVAIHEGARPGELDALMRDDLDFTPGAETIRIERQWNVRARRITPPKHGVIRTVAMTPATRDRLLTLPRESGVHDAARDPLHAVVAQPALEPCALHGGARERRPVHRDPASLRVVRVERARARPGGHRAALRAPGRRRAGAPPLRAFRSGAVARSDPRRVRRGAAGAGGDRRGAVKRHDRSRPCGVSGG